MKEEKLKAILFAISEENSKNEEGENIKIVLNSLIGENVKTVNDLWFEAKDIKEDLEYYNIILSLIDLFLESLTSEQKIDLKILSEKIVNTLKNSKFFEYYTLTRAIFLKIDQEEKFYYDIYCSICCLGFKKGSLLNRELVYNLKDLCQYEQFQKSIYSKEIANFNFNNIDVEFLKNFNDFIEYALISPSNEKNISEIIAKLTNKDEEKSTQNEIVDKNISLTEMNENDKIIDKKLNSNIETAEIEDISNNEETETTEKEIEKDSYEKFISDYKEKNDEGNIISMKTFLLYNKRNHRLNGIFLLKSKIKEQLKEFEIISKYQKELLSYYCSIQENLIYVYRLKALINQIKAPSIINIKRKIIDLFIFWIIKKRAKFFILNPNYSPNNNYLEKILNILQSKKNNKQAEIEDKIDFIKELIEKNKSMTNFPIRYENDDIRDMISFFNFYKKKCSNIVHIGKEGLKYYVFSHEKENKLFTGNKPIFNEFGGVNENKEIKIESKNNDQLLKNENQQINTLDLDYAFKFIFESIPVYESDETTITKELKSIKEEKKVKVDNIINSISDSFNKIINMLKNISEIPKFDIDNDDDFNQDAKDLIFSKKSDFDCKIKLVRELLKNFENGEDNSQSLQNIIVYIHEQIISVVNKEFCDNDYLIEIDEKKTGKSVLFFFQYKFMKLKELYVVIHDICEIYKKYIEKQNLTIREKLDKVRQEADKINQLIKKDCKIKKGKEIYLEWKRKKHKFMKYETFITKLFEVLKGINELKIDDEIIVDEITSCWLVKYNLDKYVLE